MLTDSREEGKPAANPEPAKPQSKPTLSCIPVRTAQGPPVLPRRYIEQQNVAKSLVITRLAFRNVDTAAPSMAPRGTPQRQPEAPSADGDQPSSLLLMYR